MSALLVWIAQLYPSEWTKYQFKCAIVLSTKAVNCTLAYSVESGPGPHLFKSSNGCFDDLKYLRVAKPYLRWLGTSILYHMLTALAVSLAQGALLMTIPESCLALGALPMTIPESCLALGSERWYACLSALYEQLDHWVCYTAPHTLGFNNVQII